MATIEFFKVTTLPATPIPNAIYFVLEAGTTFSIVLTANDGTPFTAVASALSVTGTDSALGVMYEALP